MNKSLKTDTRGSHMIYSNNRAGSVKDTPGESDRAPARHPDRSGRSIENGHEVKAKFFGSYRKERVVVRQGRARVLTD